MSQSSARRYHILALISASDEIYIRQTVSNNFRSFYYEHWQGKSTATAHYFNLDTPPTLHLLETIETTSNRAYGRCIVWYLYFERLGYRVSASAVRYHIDHPRANDLIACEKLSPRDLQDILSNDLAADWYFTTAERTIAYNVSTEEYAALLAEAKSLNLTLAEYSQSRFDEKAVKYPDIRALAECSHQARTACTLADNIIRQHLVLHGKSDSLDLLAVELHSLRTAVKNLEEEILHLTQT